MRILSIVFILFALIACSDTVSNTPEEIPTNESAAKASHTTQQGFELGVCGPEIHGLKVYVREEFAYYICANNGIWIRVRIQDTFEDLNSSSSSEPTDYYSSGIDFDPTTPEESSSSYCAADFDYYDNYIYVEPNDFAAQDSASHRIATRGALVELFQGGKYNLSFDKIEGMEPPLLNLYGTRGMPNVIQAKDSANRWNYHIEGDFIETYSFYETALFNSDCSLFEEPAKNFHLQGEGKYSNHFNINLIVLGKYIEPSDKIDVETLAEKLKDRFNEALNAGNIYVDKISVFYAEDHPVNGQYFNSDSGYVLPYSRVFSNYSMLVKWEESPNALNIMLGYYIEKPHLLGFSPLFGGSLNGKKDYASYVVVGTHYKNNNGKIIASSAKEITNTAIHESGHYLGLRHTSSSIDDLDNELDKSNVEDGIEDTPYCPAVNASSKNIDGCLDRNNIIFPYSSTKTEKTYSIGQLEIFRLNLSLLEH